MFTQVYERGDSLIKPALDLLPFLVFLPSLFYYCASSDIALPKYPLVTVSAPVACLPECHITICCGHLRLGNTNRSVCNSHALRLTGCSVILLYPMSLTVTLCLSCALLSSQFLFIYSTFVDMVVHMMVNHICHAPLEPFRRTVGHALVHWLLSILLWSIEVLSWFQL